MPLKSMGSSQAWLMLVFLFVSTAVSGSETAPIHLGESLNYTLGLDDFEYKIIEAEQGAEAVMGSQGWQPSKKSALNLGMTNRTLWLRFRVRNSALTQRAWLIYYSDPLVNELDLFMKSQGDVVDHIKTGTMRPFESRPKNHHGFVFPRITDPETTEWYYLRIKSVNVMVVNITLLDEQSFYIDYRNEFALLCLYYGLIGVMFFYNIFLYSSTKDLGYLFYVLYLAAFGLLTASLNGFANQFLWPGWPWFSNHSIAIFLELTVIFLAQFIRVFVETKKYRPRLDRIFVWCVVGHLGVGFLHIVFMDVVWLTNLFVATLVPIGIAGTFLLSNIVSAYKTRPSIYTSAAFGFFLVGIMLGIFRFMGLLPDNQITRNGLLAGSAVEIVVLALGLADRINRMRSGLIEAEAKYRHIVEGASEIIFTLSDTFQVKNINSSVRKFIGFSAKEVSGRPFVDFIQEYDQKQTPVTRQVVEATLQRIVESKKGATFIAPLRRKHGVEPVQLTIRLDFAQFDNTVELFGRAALVDEDLSSGFLLSEKVAYKITNSLNNAEIISQKLTQALSSRLDKSEVSIIRICLREMIINAIEHGNLEISFEEKSELLREDGYIDFLKGKMHDPKYVNRQVHIECILSETKVVYQIADEGDGFDLRAIDNKSSTVNDYLIAHGRGIAMTREAFDEMVYNDKGNRVTLVKYFEQANGGT